MGIQLHCELSETELDLMEMRSEAASAGPWLSLVVGRDLEAGLNCIVTSSSSALEVLCTTVTDQDFIANARDDLPRLILEVRRLRRLIGAQSSAASQTMIESVASLARFR